MIAIKQGRKMPMRLKNKNKKIEKDPSITFFFLFFEPASLLKICSVIKLLPPHASH
jgi:hypothetical protein